MKQNLTPKQRKKLRQRRRRRFIFLSLLLCAIIISVCLFTPFFNVKTVDVKGNQAITTEKILETAAVPANINIFKIKKNKIEKAILSIPEIESVKVRRIIPSKVRLEVVETAPVLYFPYKNAFILTNEKGRVMAKVDSVEGLNLLNVTGLEIQSAEICEQITVQDKDKFEIITNTITAISRAGLLQEFRSCHFDDMQNVHMYLHDGTKIIFGKLTDLEYKLSVMSKVLLQVNRTEGAYIDLTTPEKTYYGIQEEEPPAEGEATEGEVAEGEQPAEGEAQNQEANAQEAKPEEANAQEAESSEAQKAEDNPEGTEAGDQEEKGESNNENA